MTAYRPGPNAGKHLFGAAAVAFGVITLAWHSYQNWRPIFVYAAAIAWIIGGSAVQFRLTSKIGAVVLGAVYLIFALRAIPQIVAAPGIYNSWGNFFEQFSLFTGAALIYSPLSSAAPRIALGICTCSFALEQAYYLAATAVLVPKWLPPSQMFWAIATTILFALAALALLANRMALPAARLLTMMILGFGVLVWIPVLLTQPRSHENESETAETFAIAGATWILADLLARTRSGEPRSD